MTEKGLKYLSDITQAIDLVYEFTLETPNFEEFSKDIKTQSAVERQLGIVGEAVNKFTLIHPEIELENSRQIVGFRNRIIHAYDAVDSAMVWVIIKRYLRPLQEEVRSKIN
jgi:uncharacterized protein with HEPN domain